MAERHEAAHPDRCVRQRDEGPIPRYHRGGKKATRPIYALHNAVMFHPSVSKIIQIYICAGQERLWSTVSTHNYSASAVLSKPSDRRFRLCAITFRTECGHIVPILTFAHCHCRFLSICSVYLTFPFGFLPPGRRGRFRDLFAIFHRLQPLFIHPRFFSGTDLGSTVCRRKLPKL